MTLAKWIKEVRRRCYHHVRCSYFLNACNRRASSLTRGHTSCRGTGRPRSSSSPRKMGSSQARWNRPNVSVSRSRQRGQACQASVQLSSTRAVTAGCRLVQGRNEDDRSLSGCSPLSDFVPARSSGGEASSPSLPSLLGSRPPPGLALLVQGKVNFVPTSRQPGPGKGLLSLLSSRSAARARAWFIISRANSE